MVIESLSNDIDIKKKLQLLGVDSGGIEILASKAKHHIISIKNLPVGGANILKQDALSVGADLAVPRGTVVAATPKVDALLIASTKALKILAKKELSQPFGLKELAKELDEIVKIKEPKKISLMGVINANDDSFFAKSRFGATAAISMIEKMINDGAKIIDIGAVSSRPGALDVSAEVEYERLAPIAKVIYEEKLYEKVDFSCDSYEPKVLRMALESGFNTVNDIRGLESDEVCRVAAEYGAKVVIMHMQGRPQTMQLNPKYNNILDEVYKFLELRVQKAESFGIEEIILDVGIGFGKSLDDNLRLIKHLNHFKRLNKELLVGASRKSMIDQIVSSRVEERLPGTLALHLEAVRNGASILRVHDVFEHYQALKVFSALDTTL